jgi:hypothetical protein
MQHKFWLLWNAADKKLDVLERDSRLIADFLPTLRGTQEAFQQMQM